MATQNLALKPAESEPFIPDEDIERLIAEMFGRARKPASRLMTPPTPTEAPPPVAPPQHVPALAPEPVAVPASTFAPEIDGEVEPLQIRSETRRSRGRGWTTPFALSVLAIGGGWWLAASGLIPPPSVQPASTPQNPPVIAAAPPAASRVIEPTPAPPAEAAPPAIQPRPAPPQLAAIPPAPAPVAPPPQVAPQSTSFATTPAPPPDSAGVLGTPQQTPFDAGVAPRSVRTTAVIPPRLGDESNAVKPIDFDDPATWPPGAEKADPHPLPPRRQP